MAFDNFNDVYTKDELMKLGIYDLRKIGQDVGVVSPTSAKKEELVDKILAVIYGNAPKRKVGKGRGRPPKTNARPSKLYINLIESIKEPEEGNDFICQTSYTSSSANSSKVASPKQLYLNDNKSGIDTLKRGIVCQEEDKLFVRKLRFIQTEEDYPLPLEIAKEYGLKDCDLIEYLLDGKGKKVSQIIKINGQLAYNRAKAFVRHSSKDVLVGKDLKIKTNESNIVLLPTAHDREVVFENASKELLEQGYMLVRVNLDKVSMAESDDKIVDFYCSALGDEYEAIACTEVAVDRAIFTASSKQDAVLIIDNLGWLMSVVNSFPKYLYGNFIAKIGRLTKNTNLNLTVIALASDLTDQEILELSKFFDNIIKTEAGK